MKKPTHKKVSFTCEICWRDYYESTSSTLQFSFIICENCNKHLPDKKELRESMRKALQKQLKKETYWQEIKNRSV